LAVKDNILITPRVGVYDGNPYPKGFGVRSIDSESFPASVDLSEPIELLNNLYDYSVRLVNITAGNPHFKPHLTRPYDQTSEGGHFPEEHPLFSLYRLIYLTSEIKRLIPSDMKTIGSGYSYLRQFSGNLASGTVSEGMTDICGFGRMAFANPNFAKQIFEEKLINKKETCISCSKCSQFMREGKSTGCAIRDPMYKNKN